MADKKIRVGVDFDGVVAYNPARILRGYVKWFKRRVLGITRLSFMVPKNPVVKLLWILIHESSVFPARGIGLLKTLAAEDRYEFYLITGRFPILERSLRRWLKRNKLEVLFKTVCINTKEEQPHLFKQAKIEELNLDYYIEDNLDIVEYLSGKTKTKVFWIYNVADRNRPYQNKFPYLEKALEAIF